MANATKKATNKNSATKKVETKKTVKPVAKTTAVKTVETKEVKTKKVNASKINLSMTEFEAMLKEAAIQFKPNNCEYRILRSNTAIHIHKNKIFVNCTNEDFQAISTKVKTEDIKLMAEGNKVDKKRPDRVEFTTVDTLKAVIKAIAPNNKMATA